MSKSNEFSQSFGRRITKVLLISAAFMLSRGAAARADAPFFMGLGDLPGGAVESRARDISDDGSVVVGLGEVADGSDAFRWNRETGMSGLGAITAFNNVRVSSDGSTIITYTGAGSSGRPVRWTEQDGLLPLPFVGFDAYARGINGDGSIVVGQFDNHTGVRWSESTGFDSEVLFGSALERRVAWDVSDDGSVILGRSGEVGAFIWTFQDGISLLPQAPGGAIWFDVEAISGDGKVVIGEANGRAVRWTQDTGIVELPALPNGDLPALARGVSRDGSYIVGRTENGGIGSYIWDAVHGSRSIEQLLANELGLGQSIAGWDLFQSAWAVTADGRTIVGTGVNPDGNTEAWMAYLGTPVPEPNTAALAVVALLPFAWRGRGLRGCFQFCFCRT